MSLYDSIFSVLHTNSAVLSLVNNRIYPLVMPTSVIMPAINYQTISTIAENGLSGSLGLDNVRLQVDCWDNTLLGATILAKAVRDAVALTPIFGLQVMSLDDYDVETELFRVIQDFSIWYSL